MAILGTNDIGDGQLAININHDPTVTATDAPKGSLLLRTDVSPPVLYIKTDDGSTTNVNTMGQVGVLAHNDLTGVTSDQHHNKSHGNLDHTTGVAPADVTKAVAAEGTSAAIARADHKHDVSTAAPSNIGTANAEGTATSLGRSDHIHKHGANADVHSSGQPVTLQDEGTPVTNTPHTTLNFVGSGVSVADAGSGVATVTVTGGTPSFGPPTGNIDIGDAAVEGVSTNATRADHQHAFPAPTAGYPVDTDFSAEADGTATTPARSDHKHSIPAPSAPANVDGTAAAAGASTNVARQDHKHNVNFGTPVTVGNANATGTATTLPRSDHVHAGLPMFLFCADQLDNPVNANWAVNALAPAAADSVNAALVVRRFDDTTEEGAGFLLTVPPWATSVTLTLKSRAQTAPAATRTVGLKLYYRSIPDNAAISVWNSHVMTDISIPTNANFQYATDTDALAAFSPAITAGVLYQFELTRINPTAGTELVGDWDLVELGVLFT